jgi:hypothetical protein
MLKQNKNPSLVLKTGNNHVSMLLCFMIDENNKQPCNNKYLYLGCNKSSKNSLQASCQMILLYSKTFSHQCWQPDIACSHHSNKISQHKL